MTGESATDPRRPDIAPPGGSPDGPADLGATGEVEPMPIPTMDEHGLLPVGIHDTTLGEILVRFCWNDHRAKLFEGFLSWLEDWWPNHAAGKTLLVDGSFVRRKEHPGDIDVIIELPEEMAERDAMVFALLCTLQRTHLKSVYHVEVMVWYRSAPRDITAFFQYIGDKAGADLRLHPKTPKGILRIRP